MICHPERLAKDLCDPSTSVSGRQLVLSDSSAPPQNDNLNMDCLFCKIVNKELSADVVFENENVLAFRDIYPKAPIHILIIPKQHIESINSENSENIAKDLILTAKNIIKRDSIKGCKLVFNVGKEGGQTVDHLHMHLLSGNE